MVVVEGVDHLLRAPRGQQIAEVTRDEEVHDRRQRVEEGTYAQHDQPDVDDLPRRGVGLAKATDRRDGVERPAERVPRAHALGHGQADGAHGQETRHHRPQQGYAPREHPQLTVCGGA